MAGSTLRPAVLSSRAPATLCFARGRKNHMSRNVEYTQDAIPFYI